MRGFAPPLRGSPPGPGAPRPPGPARYARQRAAARARGTAGRVPAHKGPPVPRGLRPHPSCSRARPAGPSSLGLSAGLFAHSASPPAPGPPPPRGSAPARRGRRRFAGPVRGIAAALRLPGPPLGPRPPAPPLGRSARLRASSGSRWPRAPCRPIRAAVGSLIASPLLCSGSAVGLPWPRRGPLRAARFAASGAAGSVARGGGGLAAAFSAAPRALAPRPRQRGLGSLPGGAVVAVGLSPAPPRPAAPAGGSGERVASGRASPPRCVGRLFAAPLAGPPRAARGPRRGISARLTVRKLSTGVPPAAVSDHFTRRVKASRWRGLSRSVSADAVSAPGLDPPGAENSPGGA